MIRGLDQPVFKKIVSAAYNRTLNMIDADDAITQLNEELVTEFITLWASERPQLVFGLDDIADAVRKALLTSVNVMAVLADVEITDDTSPSEFFEAASGLMHKDLHEIVEFATDIASHITYGSRNSTV